MSEEITNKLDEIGKALAKAQGEFKPLNKNKEVKVKTKTAGTYTFKYADYTACIEATKDALANNGLSVSQTFCFDTTQNIKLLTTILHSSGQTIVSKYPLVWNTNPQQFGSTVTYARRYSYCAALNLSADDDDDGNLGAGNTAEPINRQQQKPAQQAPKAPKGISEAQMNRLYAIAKNNGHEVGSVLYLKNLHFLGSIKDMTKQQYDFSCTWLEKNNSYESSTVKLLKGPDKGKPFSNIEGHVLQAALEDVQATLQTSGPDQYLTWYYDQLNDYLTEQQFNFENNIN